MPRVQSIIKSGRKAARRRKPVNLGSANAIAVMGTGRGDCGKGTTVDFLASIHSNPLIVRFNGGPNAAHWAVDVYQRSHLHSLVPAGLSQPHAIGFLSKEVLIDPKKLSEEIGKLEGTFGVSVKGRLFISPDSFLVFPFHVALNRMLETSHGSNFHGSIGVGVGESVLDRQMGKEWAIQVRDLGNRELFKKKLKVLCEAKLKKAKEIISVSSGAAQHFSPHDFDAGHIFDMYISYASLFSSAVKNLDINKEIEKGRTVIFEGSQGALIDCKFGTPPFLTKTDTLVSGIEKAVHLKREILDFVLGVLRPYAHRYGPGPLPTEISSDSKEFEVLYDEIAHAEWPQSFRIGWLDMPALRFSHALNVYNLLAITNLDRLDGFRKIKVCVDYQFKGTMDDAKRLAGPHARMINPSMWHTDKGKMYTSQYIPTVEYLSRCVPHYIEVDGWMNRTANITEAEKLPWQMKKFLEFISDTAGVPIGLVSLGERRDQKLLLNSA